MSDRTFTLDEAQSLLPVLESLLRTAIGGKKLMEEVEGEMQELGHRIFLNGGTPVSYTHLAALGDYQKKVDSSWIKDELWKVRNMHQGFAQGLYRCV